MTEILGKVTASYEVPRGADVSLRIGVPAAWLEEGRTIEVELPRNLLCARCSGGGCGACNQSGAITLRGRTELPEVLQVVLPMQRLPGSSERHIQSHGPAASDGSPPGTDREPENQPSSARPVVIRIPECGGLPDASNGAIVRGLLLLEVGIADVPSPNVHWIDDEDEPLSSSKMLRAEVRPSQRQSTGEAMAVSAKRSSHTALQADDAAEPPASRVARTGTPPPADARVAGAEPAAQSLVLAPTQESGLTPPVPAAGQAGRQAIYFGIALLAILGILLLILL